MYHISDDGTMLLYIGLVEVNVLTSHQVFNISLPHVRCIKRHIHESPYKQHEFSRSQIALGMLNTFQMRHSETSFARLPSCESVLTRTLSNLLVSWNLPIKKERFREC